MSDKCSHGVLLSEHCEPCWATPENQEIQRHHVTTLRAEVRRMMKDAWDKGRRRPPSPKLELPQEVLEAMKWYAEHEGVEGQRVCESVFPALTYKAGQALAAFIRRIAGEEAK